MTRYLFYCYQGECVICKWIKWKTIYIHSSIIFNLNSNSPFQIPHQTTIFYVIFAWSDLNLKNACVLWLVEHVVIGLQFIVFSDHLNIHLNWYGRNKNNTRQMRINFHHWFFQYSQFILCPQSWDRVIR